MGKYLLTKNGQIDITTKYESEQVGLKHNPVIEYDEYSNVITIDGMKFSYGFFKMLKDPANEGAIVKLENIHGNVLTMTKVNI